LSSLSNCEFEIMTLLCVRHLGC